MSVPCTAERNVDFSEIPATFRKAGEITGVRVVKDKQNSDAFFNRSDNQAQAETSAPAHMGLNGTVQRGRQRNISTLGKG